MAVANASFTSPHRVGPRIGLDENGLGPRLGPLIVTAAYAEVDDQGVRLLRRKLPLLLRADLNDSKALVSSKNYSLAEAWARAVCQPMSGPIFESPQDLLRAVCPESHDELRRPCPASTKEQCWSTDGELFISSDEQVTRIRGHLDYLQKRGVTLRAVRSDIVCTGELNRLKQIGVHRFLADLHAMERLILKFREQAQKPVNVTCGKVGGISKYGPFFGPLAGRLHTVLDEGQGESAYYFPTLGTLRFVRDADASDPLVMLASLVGKYVRELMMGRIARFYESHVEDKYRRASGYHDPITDGFVLQTSKARKRLKIVGDCFERRPA